MAFSCSDANPQRNFRLDHGCAAKLDRVELVKVPGYAGERTLFVHEYGDSLCLYTGSSVQVYSRDFSKSTLIGSLPLGPSILFLEDGAWAAHEGPVKRYDQALVPVAEEYVVPHGGPWTLGLGLFPEDDSLSIALNFGGGPRERAPAFFLNRVQLVGAPGDRAHPPRLQVMVQYDRDGEVESAVQIEDRLCLGAETGLLILGLDGAHRAEVRLEGGYQHLAASLEEKAVGGFTRKDGRWLYLEYDAAGRPRCDYSLAGAERAGHVVFAADGARYLMSERRLVKLGKDGQRIWSYSVQSPTREAPRFIVFQDGRSAFLDGKDLVLLDPAGVQHLRIPIPAGKIVSPPYLDSRGVFWLGLANQPENLAKVVLVP